MFEKVESFASATVLLFECIIPGCAYPFLAELPLVQVLASSAAASSEGWGMATLAFLAAGGESDPEPGVQSSTGAGGTAEEEAGVATELDIYWKEHMSYSFGCQHKQTTSPHTKMSR